MLKILLIFLISLTSFLFKHNELSADLDLSEKICKSDVDKVQIKFDNNEYKYLWEFSVSEILLMSQKYSGHFFSDYDSKVKPFPALGKLITAERYLGADFKIGASILIPYREEQVFIDDKKEDSFNFSKTVFLGVDYLLGRLSLTERGWIEFRPALGIMTPLSKRLAKYTVPTLLIRNRVSFTGGSGLLFQFGYSGLIRDGTWFISFGVGYRL